MLLVLLLFTATLCLATTAHFFLELWARFHSVARYVKHRVVLRELAVEEVRVLFIEAVLPRDLSLLVTVDSSADLVWLQRP